MTRRPQTARWLLLAALAVLCGGVGTGIIVRGADLSSPGVPVDPPGAGRLHANPASGLLPTGTSSTPLTVTSPAAASCTLDGIAMPADPARRRHTGQVRVDPDPRVVTTATVRCDDRPDDPLTLSYRALPAPTQHWPRTANLWGADWASTGPPADVARVDLWLGADDLDAAAVRRLRTLNPTVRVLASFNAVEWADGLPDDFYLRDHTGHRVEAWPGAFRLNLTLPKVADWLADQAYRVVSSSGWRFDGLFIDNVMTTQSWLSSDLHGRPFHADADADGRDDPADQLDAAWRAGAIREISRIRALLPHAVLVNHSVDWRDPQVAPLFDGSSLGFDVADAKEGNPPAGQTAPTTYQDIDRRYQGWTREGQTATVVEAGIPTLLAYGYGYRPQDAMPPATLEFARTYYPYLRWGFGVAAMRDGYLAFEVGDSWHGNPWLSDEQRVDLGTPLGPARPVPADPVGAAGAGPVLRRDFTRGSVLLNTGPTPVTVPVGPGLRRLSGSQAPADQRIVDDAGPGFATTGDWRAVALDSGPLKASGPFFHSWGGGGRLGTGTARWDLDLPAPGGYTVSVWWPAAPQAAGWSGSARYEVVSGGVVVAGVTLDQRSGGDTWHPLGTAALAPGAFVRLSCPGPAPCLADAVTLSSQRRYNDGSPVETLTLAGRDAAVLVSR